jgi:hypothetical protein
LETKKKAKTIEGKETLCIFRGGSLFGAQWSVYSWPATGQEQRAVVYSSTRNSYRSIKTRQKAKKKATGGLAADGWRVDTIR